MITPISWQSGWGLSVGDGSSLKSEGAEFKRQQKERMAELSSMVPDADLMASMLGATPDTPSLLTRGLATSIVVEETLIGLTETARLLGISFELAEEKGDKAKTKEIMECMSSYLVPRFRNAILAIMNALDDEDRRALRLVVNKTDEIERFRMAQEQAAPTAANA